MTNRYSYYGVILPEGWEPSEWDRQSMYMRNPKYPKFMIQYTRGEEYPWLVQPISNGRLISGIFNSYQRVKDAIDEVKERSGG